MKFGTLKSLGHNVADSVASGIGLMIGVYEMNVFTDATSSKDGFVKVDFLRGKALGTEISTSMQRAIQLYREALPRLCEKHGIRLEEISELEAKFGVDPVYGPHFTVTVENTSGRRSSDQYIGVPGKRSRRRLK